MTPNEKTCPKCGGIGAIGRSACPRCRTRGTVPVRVGNIPPAHKNPRAT